MKQTILDLLQHHFFLVYFSGVLISLIINYIVGLKETMDKRKTFFLLSFLSYFYLIVLLAFMSEVFIRSLDKVMDLLNLAAQKILTLKLPNLKHGSGTKETH